MNRTAPESQIRALPTAAARARVPRSRVIGSAARAAASSPTAKWLYGFVAFEFLCQLALLIPLLAPIRALFRTAAFGASLVLLVVVPGRPLARHPARPLLVAVFVILVLQLLNPGGVGMIPALAQIAVYLAVAAPLYWIARIDLKEAELHTTVLVLWGYYSISSLLGVLQTYFPGQFQPALSTVISSTGDVFVESLRIELASGARVFRPMGLTDVPGGVAQHGFYVVLFALGLLQLKPRFAGARLLFVISMLLGMVVLYLSQLRVAVVMLAICSLTMLTLLAVTGRVSRLMLLVPITALVVMIGFVVSVSVAGTAVTERLETLIQGDVGNVYYQNRGRFLEQTFNHLLPTYPLGAGLARWGMMNYYFADRQGMIWAEIQWTGWLLDGGVPLMLAYFLTLLVTTWFALRTALNPTNGPELRTWGALLFTYDLGALAATFSVPLFAGAAGLEFWMLNATFFQVCRGANAARRAPPPAARPPLRRSPSSLVRARDVRALP